MSAVRDAVEGRRSYSKVTDEAPGHQELVALVASAARVADHGSLQPWRVVELRGAARDRLGQAMVQAAGALGKDAEKLAAKPLRAPLLIAIVTVRRDSEKVPEWEQDAAASGVAHVLSLLLHDAGWGVMWRTGAYTRTTAVARMHGLAPNERLMGWLYVGGIPEGKRAGTRKPIDVADLITVLD
ncbi:MAG TPA: nitroreductase [Humibacter sp.]|nr:nitroreductase [Humibacter sp.]